MRSFKAFLFGITGLFIIITLFSLLMPSRVLVSRVILINATTPGEVYGQIAHFENWKKWHPVFIIDSAQLFRGEKDSSNTITQREKQIIIRPLPSDSNSVQFLMQAKGENDIENDISITPLAGQQSVQVEWRAITKLHWYPWEKVYGIFIDKLTGPGYEAALHSLKEYIESGYPATGN